MGKFAIERPVTILMLTLFYVTLGVASYMFLSRDLFPKIHQPTLQVVTEYPGAAAKDIEEQVTKKLEEQLGGVKGLKKMHSLSGREEAQVVLEFDFDTNLDFASIEVREKLDQIEDSLPSSAERPIIERFDPTAQAVLLVNFSSSEADSQLRKNIENGLRLMLERVSGVARVDFSGGTLYEIRFRLDPNRLRRYQISLTDVESAFLQENLNLRGGRLVESDQEFLVRTVGKLISAKDLINLVIPAGNVRIRLKDVLQKRENDQGRWIYDIAVEPQQNDIARLRGEKKESASSSVQVAIFKKPGKDTVGICQRSKDIIENYTKENPQIQKVITYDQSIVILQSLDNIKVSAAYGIVLAVIILLIFLRNIESTIIVALAMPVSVVAAFALFSFVDMGLNLFSMAGLTLAVGMVVDNAIVIIESVFANMRTQRRVDRAIIFSITEVGPPIFASTLTTLAVFIPLLFVEGLIGQIFRDLSYTIIFTLIFSLIVAFTFIPMLFYRFVGNENSLLKLINFILDKTISLFFGWIAVLFQNGYRAFMAFVLQRWITRLMLLCAVIALFLESLAYIPQQELLPDSKTEEYVLTVSCSAGLSLEEKDRTAREIEEIFTQDMEFRNNIRFFTTNVDNRESTFFLNFRTSEVELQKIRQKMEEIPNLDSFSISGISPLQTLFGDKRRDLTIQVEGLEVEKLQEICQQITSILQSDPNISPHIVDLQNSLDKKNQELLIEVDKEKAAQYEITTKEIAENISLAIAGRKVAKIGTREHGRLNVYMGVALPEQNKDAIQGLPLQGESDALSLNDVANIVEQRVPMLIMREERQRVGVIWANLHPSKSKSLGEIALLLTNNEKTGLLDRLSLPEGYQVKLVGASEAMAASFSSLAYAMIAAVILIYMVMASQFESLLHPFAIMFSLPLACIGAIFALYFTGVNFSTPALIGLIMLAGIVVNNAIILIDYINILRDRGADRDQAILRAGQARMRPIFMTTLTTSLGMLPMAMGIGSGAELYQPLAIVVIGGLSFATLLTLVFIPTIYCFFDDISELIEFIVFRVSMFVRR